jgi:hypothetical protein
MKVKVEYTYEIEGEDLAALTRYNGEKMTRDTLRQLLIDLGRGGIEEQINQGRTWIEHEVEAL